MKKFNKYNNKKVFTQDGLRFDSQKEFNRFNELMMMQRAGIISELKRQVKFLICPKTETEQAAYYVADFVYTKADGKKIIEDVKSKITKQLPLYILKRKLVKKQYPNYQFIET